MTNVRPERRETYAPHYHRKKLVTAKKATTTGGKIKFISQFWTAAKTNFLFRAHFRHSRYCSLILTDFLTGAIMESQKAAWSKAISSPPAFPLALFTAWTMILHVACEICSGQILLHTFREAWYNSWAFVTTSLFCKMELLILPT